MYISKLSIRNFRNFRNISLEFNKGVNTIIGENGCGKTNILQALRFLIDENLPRYIRLYESDFNRSLDNWKGHWIIIQLVFDQLDYSEEAQAIAMHKAGSMDELDLSRGSYSLIFRPRENKRRELYTYSQDESKSKAGLDELLDYLTLADYKVTFRGRGDADFTDDDVYREFVGDFENVVFPNPDEQQNYAYGIKLSGFSITNEISCTFIKALRDVEADLRSYRNNPLLNLLRGKEKHIDVVKKAQIIDQVKTLNADITALDEVMNVSQGISGSISSAVGETYAPSIAIRSELPEDMEKLLQSIQLWVGDPDDDGHKGRIWEPSIGAANLIYFSLKLLEYEKVKSDNKIANFLLIEEPEAHIHTHIQKTLFQKLHNHDTQIIITTHSTHISSVSKISSLNVLNKIERRSEVFNPSKGLSEREVTGIERYLDAVRTNLMFAKGVILVEGDAEQIMIPSLFNAVFGITLDEIGISLVNIGSTGFQNIAGLFHEERLRKKCSILTDLDQSIYELPEDKDCESYILRKARNSQIAGADRKISLDEFCEDNPWINVFYADYTFEVDFILRNNSAEVIAAMKTGYKATNIIDKIESKLKDKSVEVAGAAVLKLAEKFGKGWFAIMLADKLDHLTYVPDYILKAIAFAAKNISGKILLVMANFRLAEFVKSPYSGDTNDYNSILIKLNGFENVNDALNFYLEEMPSDQLSRLMLYILADA